MSHAACLGEPGACLLRVRPAILASFGVFLFASLQEPKRVGMHKCESLFSDPPVSLPALLAPVRNLDHHLRCIINGVSLGSISLLEGVEKASVGKASISEV